MRKKALCLLAAVVGLAAAACSTDPTTSDEYRQLEEAMAGVETELEDVRAANAGLESQLETAEADADEMRGRLASETERADSAEARAEEVTAANDVLTTRLDDMVAGLELARSLIAIEAADTLTGDPDAIAQLPEELHSLREDLSDAIGWFDDPATYNLFLSFRAYNTATDAVDATGDAALADAWDAFWQAESGSLDEAYSVFEFRLRQLALILDRLDTAIASATGTAEASSSTLICGVTDIGGIDDRGFNQLTSEGLRRAAEDSDVESMMLESRVEADYGVNLRSLIDQGCGLVVAVGFLLGDSTLAASVRNSGVDFAIVDWAYDDPPRNLKGLVFNANEAAFLAGYLAAGMTQTATVGTYGGLDIPPVTIFMDGFARGVRHYNDVNGAGVEVLGWDVDTREGLFTGNFESLADGRTFAQRLVDQGADIVMPVAGPVGLGSAELASELGTLSIIGVDVDGTRVDPANAAVYLTSVLKGVEQAVYTVSSESVNGTFTNSAYVGTLANGGVDIAPFHDWDSRVPEELKAEIDALRQDIIDGEVSVFG